MGQKSSVVTLEVLTLIKHVHRFVLACFHAGVYIIFWVKKFIPPIPPTFEKVPILGGGSPGFFQLTEPCYILQ